MARGGNQLDGLDQVRLALVLVLIGVQSLEVTQSFTWFAYTPMWILGPAASAGLFAALGLALASSRDRRSSANYMARAAVSAIPAALFAVVAAFGLLGTLLTSLSVRDYLASRESWSYLLNLALLPQATLPGVFEFNNLVNVVNEATWTFPVFILTVATGLGAARRRRSLIIAAGIIILSLAVGFGDYAGLLSDPLGLSGTHRLVARFIGALIAGQIGLAAYQSRDRFTVSLVIASTAAALLGAIAVLGNRSWANLFLAQSAIAVASAYLVIWVSALRLPLRDISVAARPLLTPLFLFSFPIQQVTVLLGPFEQNGLLNLSLALPLTLMLALAFYLLVSRTLIPRLYPRTVMQPPPPLNVRALASSSSRIRRFAHDQAGNAVVMVILILVVLAALALTVFASQHSPGD